MSRLFLRVLLVLVVPVLGLVLVGPAAHACSCVSGSFADRLQFGGPVFIGTVTDDFETVDDYGRRVYQVDVETVLRGEVGEQVDVQTGLGGGDCGITLEHGTRYLVAAHESEGVLMTSICSATTSDPDQIDRATLLLGQGSPPLEGEQTSGGGPGLADSWWLWGGPALALIAGPAYLWLRMLF